MVESPERARADAVLASEHGTDCVEYRVDGFFGNACDIERVCALSEGSPLPCIVTCRPVWEGGQYEGDETARVALWEAFIASAQPPSYIDIELAAMERSDLVRAIVRKLTQPPATTDQHGQHGSHTHAPPRLILSTHDFQSRPSDLHRKVLAMASTGAAVHKYAFRARSLRDNMEIFELLANRTAPTIALGMGEFGLMSRVLGPKFGGFLTFASLRESQATAPGQPTLETIRNRYRFGSIDRSTRVYGIIGWPIGHSMSPLIHNAGFAKLGLNSVYLPLPIAAAENAKETFESRASDGSYESFKATLLELMAYTPLSLCGASVTMPHKANLVRLGKEQGWSLDPIAAQAGVANTLSIVRETSGEIASVMLSNTDAVAAIGCIERALGNLEGKHIAVLGAGGVARAIVFALAKQGAQVTIYNRSFARASTLAKAAGANACSWDERTKAAPDLFLNCTPIGMAGGPAPEESPLPAEVFLRDSFRGRCNAVVMETVYNPVRTPFLRDADAAGLQTIDGVEMFIEQGAVQFEGWTGHDAPRVFFDSLVREKLSD